MKIKILLIIALVFSFNSFAQEWSTNFEESKRIATEKNQKIILVFQGSDWCAPCIKLDREVWSTDEFKAYANKKYVMLKADFPRKKKNALSKSQQDINNNLAEKYNKNGNTGRDITI